MKHNVNYIQENIFLFAAILRTKYVIFLSPGFPDLGSPMDCPFKNTAEYPVVNSTVIEDRISNIYPRLNEIKWNQRYLYSTFKKQPKNYINQLSNKQNHTYHYYLKWWSQQCVSVWYLWCHFPSSRICNLALRSHSHTPASHLQKNITRLQLIVSLGFCYFRNNMM